MSGSCQRCRSALEAGDLRCPVCSLVVPAGERAEEAVRVEVFRCLGCGAAVGYDPEAGAPRCAFCGDTLELEAIEDPVEQTELHLPFTVERGEADEALKGWLDGLGWFRPGDLASTSTLESASPLWFSAWLVDAEALISWTADSNAGARRSSWAPHSGQAELEFHRMLVSASRGLSETEVEHVAGSFDLEQSTPGSPEAEVRGAIVERFDVQRSAARRTVQERIRATSEDRVRASEIPGSSYRNVHVAVRLSSLRTHRYALPVYVLAYRYRDRPYRAVVSGHDAGCVTGTAPLSWPRIVTVVAVAMAVVVALLLWGLQ